MAVKALSTDQSERDGWSQPLRVHLGIVMVLLLLAIAGSLIGFNYWHSHAEAVHDASGRMRIFASRLLDRYHILSDSSVMFTELSAISDAFAQPPPHRLESKIEYLKSIVVRSPETDGAFAGYPNGEFIHVVDVAGSPEWQKALNAPPRTFVAVRLVTVNDGVRLSSWRFLDEEGRLLGETRKKPTNYDPRLRPWYAAAAGRKGAVATQPYTMATTGELGMTIAEAHRMDPRIVIGVDVVMETLSRFLTAQRITPGAATLILDDKGEVLIRSADAIQIADGLAAFTRSLPVVDQSGDQVEQVKVDGRAFLVDVTRVGPDSVLSGARIVVAAPVDELTAEATRALRNHMILSAAILLVGIGIALVIARRITVSLRILTGQANDLRRLVLSDTTRVRSRISEIAELGKAMAAARQALRSFGLYVPREIVRAIVADGQFLDRSATRQDVTALFTDIKDFTSISERHSPEEVVAMLSAYFDVLNAEIVTHKGALIQFNGDSIFAIWNAPNADPEHVARGCACALALKQAIGAFNAGQRARGLPEFITRIGLHTGPVVVGSVGAEDRLQYTGMGDTINLASRLEGLNKDYGTTILVSQAVAERAGGAFAMRRIDTVKVKGRVEAVTIYELLGPKSVVGQGQAADPRAAAAE